MSQAHDLVTYPVMEHFYTIQGEGAYTGCAAYFIRLGGCDVGCVWCDVKDSWDADKHPQMSVKELTSIVKQTPANIVVITGGEPAMYDLHPLITSLQNSQCRVHIETSGAYPIQGEPDWICLSPKKFKFPITESLKRADEFKAVVFHKSDIPWALTYTPELKSSCINYLQPEWSKADEVLPLIIDFVKQNPDWRISLQTHKFLNIP
jgi:organic radical activating enzyme